jgi:hypothetical protein
MGIKLERGGQDAPLVPALIFKHFGRVASPLIETRFTELCCVSEAGRADVARAMEPVGKRGFLAVTSADLRASGPDPHFRIPGPQLLIAGARDSNGDAIWGTFSTYEEAYPIARA